MKKYIILTSLFAIAIGAQMVSARINNPPAAGLSALTPWTENVDGGGYSLSNVLTAAFTNLTATNATSTGSLSIPTSATLTTPIGGNIGIDTTSGQLRYSDVTGTVRTVLRYKSPGFSYSTSTAWTATTTIPLTSPFEADTINNLACYTNTGTLNVDIYHTSTHLPLVNASTTQGITTFTSNNTMTAQEKWWADVGTPASSPTYINCGIKKTVTAD